ncbi:hypothetical protein LWI29_001611 [Acer saccharum]|uniref:C3H1-type domain-containing protein n=1 Tax=Acer saccharum TaxID=4024 RepID=A0AA39RBM9_ACESA|nr:hypothetical protein LWI29_001611 [Acer saccharum]
MDEELQKRNTDCVYFLASPLTCKKGMDCEYRHHEIARLNPRDCWYWLAGNCINPSCGFRHPPLDGHGPEAAPSESAPLLYQSSAPVNKTSVPCYFYFNGFCNKGDRCSFLHGPDGGVADEKSSKTTSAIAVALPSENMTNTGNVGTAQAETHSSPLEHASKPTVVMRVLSKDDLLKSSPKIMPSALPHMSVSEGEEAVVIKSVSMVPAEGFIQTRSHLFTEQICDEQVDDQIEPEDRWESSPGFDVLVDNDNRSENLGYEDDSEYILSIDREHRELNNLVLGYDFEDPVEYDPMYPDAYEHNVCSGYDGVDNEHIFYNVREPPRHARETMLDLISPRKRKFLPMKSFNDHSSVDLRDYLRKRKVVDGNPIIHSSRRHESSRVVSRSQERGRRHGMGQQLRGRLASQIGKNYMELQRGNGTRLNSTNQHEWFMHSYSSRSRQHNKEKRLPKRHSHSSQVPRKLVSRESRSTQNSITFSGPKTLAEIKEENKKAEEHGDCFEKMGRSSSASADFQGPKPLSEILKKKSVDTETESNARSC